MNASSLFTDLVATAEAAGATSKRLEKYAAIGAYLAGLTDDDLPIAARFLSGRPFPAHDERTLNIGWSAIIAVICELSGLAPEDYGPLHVKHGDIGDVAAEVMPPAPLRPGDPLTLAGVQAVYDEIAATQGSIAKAQIFRDLLARAGAHEARYLIKVATGEMRTGVKESTVEEAIARQAGITVPEVQGANMLRGDIGEVALLARHGRLSESEIRLFHPLKSMLASPIQSPAEILAAAGDAGFVFVEDKYDGVRAQAHKQDGRVELYSRTLDPVGHRFPEVAEALAGLPGEFILDGEVVAYDQAGGRCYPFAMLQKRLGRKSVTDKLLAEAPVAFMVFDLLYLDGTVHLDTSLRERRLLLDSLLAGSGAALVTGIQERLETAVLREEAAAGAALDALFDAARLRGNEGLLVKHPDSAYSPGRRGRAWLKVKKALATLDVVVTAAEWGQGRRRKVLSDFTFAVQHQGQLLNIGKAYSGLTDAELAETTEWFLEHTTKDFVAGRVVEPLLVIEVAFDNIQQSARHKSGYALRFPRIVRLRPDKPVSEINTLEDVEAMFKEREV